MSQLLEPVANTWKGDMEASSTPDMVSKVEDLNARDLELEQINLRDVDREMDELERRKNNENPHTDIDTQSGPVLMEVPVEISRNTAKQILAAPDCATKMGGISRLALSTGWYAEVMSRLWRMLGRWWMSLTDCITVGRLLMNVRNN